MQKALNKILLYYHTMKHLRPSQLLWRVYFSIKGFLYAKFRPVAKLTYKSNRQNTVSEDVFLKGITDEKGLYEYRGQLERHCKTAKAVSNNLYTFLNVQVQFENSVNWHPTDVSKLWRYNLHYFDYLFDLGVCYSCSEAKEQIFETFKTLVSSWIDNNKLGVGDGWEPYPISLRVVNWIYAYHFFREQLAEDKSFEKKFLASLFRQSKFLESNLEFHLRGNHLIKNAKALLFTGLFFSGKEAQKWVNKGKRLLLEQLEEQFCEDGGHIERSPMYHLIVLQDYLECLILLKNNGQNYFSLFDDKIRQMLNFLIEILHPDGNIPLFNDSAFGIAKSPQDLFAIGAVLFKDSRFKTAVDSFFLFPHLLLGAEGKAIFDEIIASQDSQRQSIALDSSGYYVMRDESNDKFIIIDCGEIGAEYLTGHSHCDTLSYELSIGRERIIVDSGVYAYDSGEWRDYCRSTRAHNTVVIDNKEQSEIWSAFRVARRAKPVEVNWIETENIIFFEGSHNGYTRLGQGLFHRRRIFFVEERFWIIFDDIRGSGRHTAESYIHLAPDVQFQVNGKDKDYQIHVTKNGTDAWIKVFGADGVRIVEGQMNPIQGWYLPEFGKNFKNKVIILDKAGELPFQFGYLILPYVTTAIDFECKYNLDEVRLKVRIDDSLYVVEYRADGLKFQKQ